MRPATNWHSAIAHIDADGFYAGCEAVRHPELKGRPICVLSNQNAFVVAKSYDAKALGITTAMSVWDAKRLAPNAAFLSPDFRYYGQISDKMFSILRRYSPDIEVYSIDEGFMEMNGIRSLWHKGYRQLADEIRECVKREVGITVSIGISNTRTLAKIASESNKPDGTTVIPGKRIERFLADIPAQAIPGIGYKRASVLGKFRIRTAGDLAAADEGLIRRLLGKHGLSLWYELNGQPVQRVEVNPPTPKSVARTSSMGEVTSVRTTIAAYLARHVMRLVSDLVARRLLARRIGVFLTCKSFETTGMEIRLDHPTNSLKRISKAVMIALDRLYQEGVLYRGSGVIATHISQSETATEDLFGLMHEDLRQEKLMLTVNEINQKHGNHMITSAMASTAKRKPGRPPRFQYPVHTAG